MGSVHTAYSPTRTNGGIDRSRTKRLESRLEDYRRERVAGNQPKATTRAAIEETKRESDRRGAAVRHGRLARVPASEVVGA